MPSHSNCPPPSFSQQYPAQPRPEQGTPVAESPQHGPRQGPMGVGMEAAVLQHFATSPHCHSHMAAAAASGGGHRAITSAPFAALSTVHGSLTITTGSKRGGGRQDGGGGRGSDKKRASSCSTPREIHSDSLHQEPQLQAPRKPWDDGMVRVVGRHARSIPLTPHSSSHQSTRPAASNGSLLLSALASSLPPFPLFVPKARQCTADGQIAW